MKRIHLLLVVTLMAVLVMSGCGSTPEPTKAPEATAAPEKPAEPEVEAGPEYIVIGSSAPLTG